ncbi:hypothetical protein H9L17_05700 [Thermomonas brevis]|uniref:histidine kinase n=1 Tax=Thermomonas brevis TaxID=215691 RepID=A0A7G9QWA3_9GAMM|nr:ATP-binding protein [Thermomonas brevis]QNN47628.1 hypothetical protein H9L17_05700 [Thermomonas brevis]
MSLPRKLAVLLTAFGLCLLALSHYHYGLAAQQGLLIGIVPLLFAGLLLGRTGLWATAAAYFAVLLIGAWADQRHGVADASTWTEALSNLLQPVMGCAIVALILDRLILKSDASRRRSHDLALLCRQLEVEMQEKERSQAQLVHSQRMDALGKLAGNVAHDFNNLLSVILGYATQRDGGDAAGRMAGIAAATQRGKQMTDKLMTLARATPPRRETFDVNDAVAELLPMIESMFGKRIRVVATLCRQAAWIHMDLAEFEAGVLNIAKNAGDAMTGEGTFCIETEIADGDVLLRLADDGCGMPPGVVARIFDPFFTTKPAKQGTGIGLSVVYRTVTESGGRVDVDSAPGQGTCFTLRLPLRAAPTAAMKASTL